MERWKEEIEKERKVGDEERKEEAIREEEGGGGRGQSTLQKGDGKKYASKA